MVSAPRLRAPPFCRLRRSAREKEWRAESGGDCLPPTRDDEQRVVRDDDALVWSRETAAQSALPRCGYSSPALHFFFSPTTPVLHAQLALGICMHAAKELLRAHLQGTEPPYSRL